MQVPHSCGSISNDSAYNLKTYHKALLYGTGWPEAILTYVPQGVDSVI
jgi:hypothetical protein